MIACPPPLMPKFTKFFKPILRIFESYTFIKLNHIVFKRVGKENVITSDKILHRALFLVGMALNEQIRSIEENENETLRFLERANEEKLFESILKLKNQFEVEMLANLLWWVLKVKLFNIY